MNLNRDQASRLLQAIGDQAPGVRVSFSLIQYCGSLEMAVYISQAAWLSANASDEDGWFFLEQDGFGIAETGLYGLLGSWEQGLGISRHAQAAIRKNMIAMGWLCELPSLTAAARGKKPHGDKDTAFLFIQPRGTPPRLHYQVDLSKYFQWISFQPIELNKKSENGLSREQKTDFRKSENRPHVYKREVEDVNTSSSIRADARTLAAPSAPAAASPGGGKKRRIRPSGILTWDLEDGQAALALEESTAPDVLASAVAAAKKLAGKSPVPGQVAAQIQHLAAIQVAEARMTALEQTAKALPLNHDAKAKGDALLEQVARRRVAKQQPDHNCEM